MPVPSTLDAQRKAANEALAEELLELIERYPEQRFSQLLNNFGFVQQSSTLDDPVWKDEFHLEPMALLERVRAARERLERG